MYCCLIQFAAREFCDGLSMNVLNSNVLTENSVTLDSLCNFA